jgi:membrane-associated phospholipid phosphatase
LAATYIVGDFITYRTKKLTKEIRPLAAGGDYSFPSQHTDQAFIAAMNLHHQYIGARGGTIISLAGFACASTVGYLRFARNSHWSCDVLVGAAVGMISVNLIYAFVVRLITELIRIFWQKMMERIKSGRISKSNANL